jgi:hypothetical protein
MLPPRRWPNRSASTTPQSTAKTGIYAPRVFSKRTRARFLRDRTSELTAGLGGAPSYRQRILIGRIVANEWEARRLDAKLDAGEELSGHALRARLAMETRLRLDLRDLTSMPAASRVPTLDDHLAALRERSREAAA